MLGTIWELRNKIVEVDLRDGQADNRMTRRAKKCPKCEAMMSPKFGRCLFCGYVMVQPASAV
jgi:hypothetical protein